MQIVMSTVNETIGALWESVIVGCGLGESPLSKLTFKLRALRLRKSRFCKGGLGVGRSRRGNSVSRALLDHREAGRGWAAPEPRGCQSREATGGELQGSSPLKSIVAALCT